MTLKSWNAHPDFEKKNFVSNLQTTSQSDREYKKTHLPNYFFVKLALSFRKKGRIHPSSIRFGSQLHLQQQQQHGGTNNDNW